MRTTIVSILVALLCTSLVAAQVGTQPDDYAPPVASRFAAFALQSGGLAPTVTETGKIAWSIDALGMTGSSGTIQVQKPAGATVRAAYLMAASTGFSGYHIKNTDVTIAGSAVTWDTEIANDIGSNNYFADVTSLVGGVIDASPAGIIDLTITEAASSLIDGETLVVIFDDPSKPDSTIILAFGAQKIAGDTFFIGLADPIDKNKPGFALDMSLGISYSYQSGSDQYSVIDINGNRLTTSAGGNDDGDYANGALVTTGGIGDSDTNPADPNYVPGLADDTRYDDELYDLTSFVNDGDTSIDAATLNPSADDNVYFAGFFLGATTAVVGEGIVLSPQSATNPLNALHTVTATVQNDLGDPVSGVQVDFAIVSGPNAGQTGSAITDKDGKAQFSWSSSVEGTDEVVATFFNEQQTKIESNHVTKTWVQEHEVPEFGLFATIGVALSGLAIVALRKR